MKPLEFTRKGTRITAGRGQLLLSTGVNVQWILGSVNSLKTLLVLISCWTSGISHALTPVSWFPAPLAFLGALIWGNRNRAEEEQCRNLLRLCFPSGLRWEAGQGGFPVSCTKCAGGWAPIGPWQEFLSAPSRALSSDCLGHIQQQRRWAVLQEEGAVWQQSCPQWRTLIAASPGKRSQALCKLGSQEMNGRQLEWARTAWRERERGPSRGQTQGAQQRSAGPAAAEEAGKGQRLVPGVSPCRLGWSHIRRVPAGVICWFQKKSCVTRPWVQMSLTLKRHKVWVLKCRYQMNSFFEDFQSNLAKGLTTD